MIGSVFDRLLGRLVSRSFRRGLAGEPVFLVLGAAAWLVVRSRSKDRPVVWSGTLKEGERLVLTSLGHTSEGHANGGRESGGREESGTSQPG